MHNDVGWGSAIGPDWIFMGPDGGRSGPMLPLFSGILTNVDHLETFAQLHLMDLRLTKNTEIQNVSKMLN